MTITHVVLHYSATYSDQDIGAAEIDKMHRARGFNEIGYHYVIRLDGRVEVGRSPETRMGAHVYGHNRGTIGICAVGGLLRETGPDHGHDTRTPAQIASMVTLIEDILGRHPGAVVVGHRDLGATQCPGYDAAAWWASVRKPPPTVSYRMLRRGHRGRTVVALQTALAALSFPVGTIDGDFGPKTETAVKTFQRSMGIDIDGVVGPMTWTALYSQLKG